MELSIVIIIIGFLIAGISAGTSLIKSAKLNSVITDFQKYQTAYNNFVSRYSMPPGDFDNAYAIWGTACTTLGAAGCNGYNNGIIDNLELVFAWNHLALAGMISDSIAVIKNFGSYDVIPGVSVPASKIEVAGYSLAVGSTSLMYLVGTNLGLNGALWPDNRTNIISIGKRAAFTNSNLDNSALAPEDAYVIDNKIDDGLGNVGNIRAADGNEVAQGACLDATPEGAYSLSSTTVGCILGIAANSSN